MARERHPKHFDGFSIVPPSHSEAQPPISVEVIQASEVNAGDELWDGSRFKAIQNPSNVTWARLGKPVVLRLAASPNQPTPDLSAETVTLEQHGRVIEALADVSAENEKLKAAINDELSRFAGMKEREGWPEVISGIDQRLRSALAPNTPEEE